MKFYAQLNENKICIGISQLSGTVEDKYLIEIESADNDFMWRKYENGAWSSEKFELVPEPVVYQPTNAEIQENQLIIMDALSTMYEDLVGSV